MNKSGSRTSRALIVIVTVVIVAGLAGVGLAQRNRSGSPISVASLTAPTYTSKLGFSLQYPAGWETKEVKGVDGKMGGVEVYPRGTYQVVSNKDLPSAPMPNADIKEQAIDVNGAALPLPNYEAAQAFFEAQRPFPQKGETTLETKDITIAGQPGVYIVSRDSANDLKIARAIFLAKPSPKAPYGGIILSVSYRAKQAVYSQATADLVMQSFREDVMDKLYEGTQ